MPSQIPQMKKYCITNFFDLINGWELFFIFPFFQQITTTNYYVFCLEMAVSPLFEEKLC